MKFRLLAAAVAASTLTAGVAVAQDMTSDKGKLSYAFGYDYGQSLQQLIARGEQIDINSLIKGIQDAHAKKQPALSPEQLRPAIEAFQKREEQRVAQARAEYEKLAAENKTRSDAFLAQNKSKPGVTTLPSGVQYRVIEAGNGAKPTQASSVQLHYKGSLAGGQTFLDTYAAPQGQTANPVTLKVSEIPLVGLREAVLLMPAGSRWEVVLPADKAYGNSPQSPIGPNQAVVFDVKLLGVK